MTTSTTMSVLEKHWPALLTGDAKAVHEVRKLTRQVAAELSVAEASKRKRRPWRDLRRAVAPIRDRDAAGQHLLNALKDLQVPAEEIAAFERAWQERRTAEVAEVKWPKQPPTVKRPKDFERRTAEELQELSGALLAEAQTTLKSHRNEVWHEWRKHLKAYRYTLELQGEAPQVLKDVLDGLGRLQDAEVIQDYLEGEDWLPKWRDQLIEQEQRAAREAKKAVKSLWPELKSHLEIQAQGQAQKPTKSKKSGQIGESNV